MRFSVAMGRVSPSRKPRLFDSHVFSDGSDLHHCLASVRMELEALPLHKEKRAKQPIFTDYAIVRSRREMVE